VLSFTVDFRGIEGGAKASESFKNLLKKGLADPQILHEAGYYCSLKPHWVKDSGGTWVNDGIILYKSLYLGTLCTT
jgi:hypothetical protein